MHTLDESTALFFNDVRYMAVMLAISFLIYGIFALATNITAGQVHVSEVMGKSFFSKAGVYLRIYLNQISMGAKLSNINETNSFNYVLQVWLGLLMVLVWAGFFLRK